MVERVLGAIFENATPPTKAYVTRWGSDPCESALVERESESESEREREREKEETRVRSCLLSRSPHTTTRVSSLSLSPLVFALSLSSYYYMRIFLL